MAQVGAQENVLELETLRLKEKCNRQLEYIKMLEDRAKNAEEAAASALSVVSAQNSKLITYAMEYMAIVDYFTKKNPIKREKGSITVSRQELYRLLMHNAYELPENKLRVWRDLGWTDADPGRLTRRVRVNGEVIQAIKIRLPVFEAMKGIVGV